MSDKPKAAMNHIDPMLLGQIALNPYWTGGGSARGAMFVGNLKKEPVVKENAKHE